MISAIPLNESAVNSFTKSFDAVTKVLVLGGTGWFGRTALAMLRHMNLKTHIVASNPREFSVDGVLLFAKGWDSAEIARFRPEIVLDFAYLTVDKSKALGLEQYIRVNAKLAEELYFAASLPSTKGVLTVSSGASVRLPLSMKGQPAAKAYARGKQSIEAKLAQISRKKEISVAVSRAWSVTGGHVQNPRGYAFSGMILDGLERRSISIDADHLVYRRYCAVEELLAATMQTLKIPGFSQVDSAGHLVELRELAQLVSTSIPGSRVSVNAQVGISSGVDSYFSTGANWDFRIAQSGVEPLSLEGQIENVVRSLAH